ncbi:MAG: hydantoinase B/oxoprolinase family protein, partial [Candidatus Binatia bacterium]
RRTGGRGRSRGGDGLVREIECLVAGEASVLSERRRLRPWGLAGGGPGTAGANFLVRRGRRRRIAGKAQLRLEPGDRIRIETPGGGGFGPYGRSPRT